LRQFTPSSKKQAAVAATDMAELIVDEISQADRDWRAIEMHVRELLELVQDASAPSQ
jgi:hypothetical protein